MGKTTRPLRYDLNLIPYDYTVEVINRFKGLDLVGRILKDLWLQFCTGGSAQNHLKEKEMQEDKVIG